MLKPTDEMTTTRETRIRAGRNTPKPSLELIPQPHGGALLNGGVPGHIGGTGRPASEIRKKLADILEEFGPDVVRDILTGKVKYNFVGTCSKCGKESDGPTSLSEALDQFKGNLPTHDVRLRAVESAHKIAHGERVELTVVHPDVIAKLQQQVELIASQPEWQSSALLSGLGLVWR